MLSPKNNSLSTSEANLVFRVLDANLNRAVEGLRAVEEFGRFIVSNKKISSDLKKLRHLLSSACKPYMDQWAAQRNTSEDIGAEITTADEYQRAGLADLVGANLARVNQALRALEEYSKAVVPEISPRIEEIRYRFYDIERDVKRIAYVDRCLKQKSVYVLTSGCDSIERFAERIEGLCTAGADLIQLREKNLPDGELLERAKVAAEICSRQATLFIVNDRPDIALMVNADGVHVGQEEFAVNEIRRIVPTSMLVGLSTHSIEQAIQAQQEGADYIGVGPTFQSKTKCFSEFTGVELLRQVKESISIPAFAIGGINLDNISQVAAAGFDRVAVSNVVHSAKSATEVIQMIRERLLNTETSSSPT